MSDHFLFPPGPVVVGSVKGGMPRPKPHYRVVVSNLETGKKLKIELLDLPFAAQAHLPAPGQWPLGTQRLPVGSKTTVLRQLRSWWVAH